MPIIIINTAVPFPLRVMVDSIKAMFPKKSIGNINCNAISSGLTGYSNKMAIYEKIIRITKIAT